MCPKADSMFSNNSSDSVHQFGALWLVWPKFQTLVFSNCWGLSSEANWDLSLWQRFKLKYFVRYIRVRLRYRGLPVFVSYTGGAWSYCICTICANSRCISYLQCYEVSIYSVCIIQWGYLHCYHKLVSHDSILNFALQSCYWCTTFSTPTLFHAFPIQSPFTRLSIDSLYRMWGVGVAQTAQHCRTYREDWISLKCLVNWQVVQVSTLTPTLIHKTDWSQVAGSMWEPQMVVVIVDWGWTTSKASGFITTRCASMSHLCLADYLPTTW